MAAAKTQILHQYYFTYGRLGISIVVDMQLRASDLSTLDTFRLPLAHATRAFLGCP